ncbi:hypothetical protein, partial [Pseudophaeobacter leonis]|uniref:hypothetical protein n=1 Tax=Pseudophaeobacter leonis TaxID=1144477 RepID=UPI0019D3599D
MALHALAVLAILGLVFLISMPRPANAAFTASCPNLTAHGQELALNITDNHCLLTSSIPSGATDGTEDFIVIGDNRSSGNTHSFQLFDQGDGHAISATVNGSAIAGQVLDCTAGCAIPGTHGGSGAFSFTFTFNTGTGNASTGSSVGPPANLAASGTPQSTVISTAFGTALSATVT